MVEPHITTTLTLSSAVYESLGEDVQWEIEIADGSYIYPTGRIVTASFNDTGARVPISKVLQICKEYVDLILFLFGRVH